MKKDLNMVKLFLIHAKESNILEVNINELRENFYKFKMSGKYEKLLIDYIYDEDNICLKFESELRELIKNRKIDLNNPYLFIFDIDTSYRNSFDFETNNHVCKMVSDYIQFNMNKEKVKKI